MNISYWLPVVECEQTEHGPHAQNDADEAQYRTRECIARQLRCELWSARYEQKDRRDNQRGHPRRHTQGVVRRPS